MPFLDDIKILDATQMMAGPFATMHFGDLGAEVVKVERPDRGELTRQYDPFVDGMSGYFAAINRNKHCITLDLTTEEGQDIFLELAADADVVIENFKPGTAERFGIDYDSVREENEDVIYCSIKGFGRDSPYTDNPAFDMIVQAMGGAMSITGDADGPPIRSNIPMGDIAPSAYATQSILAALYQRDANGGGGEFIEVSMLNSMISWLASRATYSLIKNEPFPRMGSKHTDFAPYANFETEDSYIVIGIASDYIWPDFCEAIDRPDLVDDPRFETNDERRENQDELYGILDGIFLQKTTDEWFDIMQDAGVPAGPIYDTLELWDDDHVKQQNLLQELHPDNVDGTLPLIRYPVNFGTSELDEPIPPQRLGQETEAYLSKLGYTEEEIESLREQGVVSSPE
jgi:crotonobetainyl-CoA:carnitine CoA-transferase CaiB-like acyl-CoA transferase